MTLRRLLLLLIVLLAPALASAQTGVMFYDHAWVIGPGNNLQPIPFAAITVCAGTTLPAPGATCFPSTTVFTGPSLTIPTTMPIVSDIAGNYFFWTATGLPYVISVSGPFSTTYSFSWTSPLSQTGNSLISTASLIAGQITDTGLTVGNCVQVTTGGLLTTSSGPCGVSSGSITATGSPTTGYPTMFTGATSIGNATQLDGIQLADQATSLQASINNCTGAGPCEVYIPVGTNLPTAPAAQITVTHTVWVHGGGMGQTIIKPTGALAAALFSITASAESVKFSDLTIDMTNAPTQGVFSYNGATRPVLENVRILYPATTGTGTAVFKTATGEMHARNLIIKGAGICVDINGDAASSQEDFWDDIVCEDPGTAGYRLLRTNTTDVGGQYLTHFKVTNPDARTTGQAFLVSSSAANTGQPFFCVQCVGDGQIGGHTYQFHNVVNIFLDSPWATNSASAGANLAAINVDNSTNVFIRGGYEGSASRDLVLSGTDTTLVLDKIFFAGSVTNIYANGSTLGNITLRDPVFSATTPMSAADLSLITNAVNNSVSTNGFHVAVSGTGNVNQTLSICDKDTGDSLPCASMRVVTGGGGAFQILNNSFAQIFSVNQTGTVATLGASQPLTQTIANGSQALNTASISANTCSTVIPISAPGVQTTDALIINANAAPSGGYPSLILGNSYLSTNSVNLLVCNPTASPIVPSAETVLWRVVR